MCAASTWLYFSIAPMVLKQCFPGHITNYHNHRHVVILHFPRVRGPGTSLAWSSAQGLTRLQSRCQPGCLVFWRPDRKSLLPSPFRLLTATCSCITEDPVLLAVDGQLPTIPKGCLQFLDKQALQHDGLLHQAHKPD